MRLVTVILVAVLVGGCTTETKVGTFPKIERLESEIQRGVSTKIDVQRVLGAPSGFGSAVLPTDPKQREVWLYQDIEVTGFKSERQGVMRAELRQRVLLVFFQQGVFDGFMWYANAGTVSY